MNNTQNYTSDEQVRLDIFLASKLNKSRSQVVGLIKKSCVFIDERPILRPGIVLKIGQNLRIEFPKAEEKIALDVDFDVEILYEDDDVLVINKPSGITVHPAPSVKEATIVDWLKHKNIRLSTISGEERYGIVHRLDKGTSGAMVIAKTNEAHEFLSEQLQNKSMGRYYISVLNPILKDDITIIEKNIGRNQHNRLKMSCFETGKYAKTMFKQLMLSEDEKNQLVACKLFTGRTHQIRVHLESINRQIIGDHIYGINPNSQKFSRILLHSYIIYFIHPKTKQKLVFSSDFDIIMKNYLNDKFDQKELNELLEVNSIINSFTSNI